MVGGLSHREDNWADGEGIVVHAASGHAEWIRNPRGSLLTVAVTPSFEVWAGGYDGQLLRVKGTRVTAYTLDGEPWILAMLATHDSVFLAGEGFIGRLEGETLALVPPQSFPPGTWRSLAKGDDGALWVVGDAAILRLRQK
jgi:hypothetical protein